MEIKKMSKLLCKIIALVVVTAGFSVSAKAGSPAPGQPGIYTGKASIVYYDLQSAKAQKIKAVVEVQVDADGDVYIELPKSPTDNSARVVETTGNFGPESGIAIKGSSSESISLGFTFNGLDKKKSMNLGGSVTLDTSENFTMVITAKKLKGLPYK